MFVFIFGQNIPVPELLLILFFLAIIFVISVYVAYRKAEDVVDKQKNQISDFSETIDDLAEKLETLSDSLDKKYVCRVSAKKATKTSSKKGSKSKKATTKKKVVAKKPEKVVKVQKEIKQSLEQVRRVKVKTPVMSEIELKKLEDRLRRNIKQVNKMLDKTSEIVEKY